MSRSFRISAPAPLIPAIETLLRAEGYDLAPEPFSPLCRKLLYEPAPLGTSIAAFFGYIYIQDRSSMLPPLALNPKPASITLDMAASPGGKTGFLAQLAGPAGLVIANEPNHSRLATLRANLQRVNIPNAVTCASPGESLPLSPASLSQILLDPPCSGWGTTAKNPRAAKIWQGAKIAPLLSIQRRLLARAANLLAPGGRLLYSTCTTNPDENEAQTLFAQTELELQPIPIAPFPGFTFQETQAGALLVDGHASQAQGFYLSLLRKPGPTSAPMPPVPMPDNLPYLPPSALASPIFDPSLLPPGKIAVFGDKVRFIPAQCGMLTPLRWQGLLLGKWANGSFTPAPRLRVCLPPPDERNAIVFETIDPIRRLLAGQQIIAGLTAPHVAIWWRNLPLGTCQNRNGRLAPSFR